MANSELRNKIIFGIVLVALSAIVYTIHYFIFHDAHHIFIYFVGDVAFVFIEVLLVTLIIHQLITAHEKKAMARKLNMVIGVFFSEVGTKLLEACVNFDKNPDRIARHLKVDKQWTAPHFAKIKGIAEKRDYNLELDSEGLTNLQELLKNNRDLLVRLLENPNLLEQEYFTELLWAVFHMGEELSARESFEGLPESDLEHMAGDIKRAYKPLLREWLSYLEHLKVNYPYLFSLAIRTNPFNPEAQPVVSE